MLVSACGLVLGLEDGVYVAPDGSDDVVVGDSSGDASSDAREPPKDVIDIEANFATCDGAPPFVTDAIYVSMSTGVDSSTCGASTAPCKTVGKAVVRAASTTNKTIYLGKGVYDESVSINSGSENNTVIQGGFDDYPDAAWVQSCDQQKATIASTKTNFSVIVDGQTATLRLIKVVSRNEAPDNESVYAIVVKGGTLTLDNALLIAQNGGLGSDGKPGDPGFGCGSGSGGAAGVPGTPGTFSELTYAPTTAGTGGQGGAGAGQVGSMGACSNNCGTCGSAFVLGVDASIFDGGTFDGGTFDGGTFDGGTFDGGGFDSGVCVFTTFMNNSCAQAGNAGCGGSGGPGGAGGKGGGASIALYVNGSSKVTLMNGVSLNTASGGNGGAGGAGGAGAPGMTGPSGNSLTCDIGCGDGGFCNFILLAGGDGGTGSLGGMGQSGGGGAGGPTYLFVAPNLMQVDAALASPNWLMNSKLGIGGTGGQPNGAAGEAKTSRTIP